MFLYWVPQIFNENIFLPCKNPEDQPEFPKIERKYFVQFMFPQDVSQKAEIFQITDNDFDALSPMLMSERSQLTPQPVSLSL